ncbi:hypothetical protein DRQ12_00915 [candidate division KSB1 bacterium]|nr:MAG: hypothetical protein DRQ12_00915 [candidate division KSB1 bacterium]
MCSFQKLNKIKQYVAAPLQFLFDTSLLLLVSLWPIEILTATPVLFYFQLPNLDLLSWMWVIIAIVCRFFLPEYFRPFFKDKLFTAVVFMLGVWIVIVYHRAPFCDYFSFLWTERFILWLVLIWITSRIRWSPRLMRKIAYSIFGIAVLISLHAIVEQVAWFRWHKALSYQPQLFAGTHHLRSSATFYNPNLLAAFLTLTIPITVWLDFYHSRLQRKRWNLLFATTLAVQAIALDYTYSRSGFVLLAGFAIALIVLGLLHSQLRLARVFLVVRASFLLLVLLGFVLTNPTMQHRMYSLVPKKLTDSKELTPEHSAAVMLQDLDPQGQHIVHLPGNRIVIWRGALKLIHYFPWTGIGFGNFRHFFNWWHAHQLVLQVTVASGLIGVGLLGILILILLKAWLKTCKMISLIPTEIKFADVQMMAWTTIFVTAIFSLYSLVEYFLGSISIVGLSGFFLGLLYCFSLNDKQHFLAQNQPKKVLIS